MIGALNLDRYLERDSLVHRSDARTKIVCTVGLVLAVGLLPFGAFAALAICWLLVMVAAGAARIGPGTVVRASFVAAPFALAAAPLIFTREGHILGTIPLGPFDLRVSGEGISDFATILLKSWVSVQAAALLTFTTPFPDLMEGMARLRVPRLMVAIVGLMYWYLFVIVEEAGRMLRARQSRSAAGPRGKGLSLVAQMKVVGAMGGTLFIRSFERSERVYAAMQARGYSGDLRPAPLAWGREERAFAVALGAALVLLTLGARVWLPTLG